MHPQIFITIFTMSDPDSMAFNDQLLQRELMLKFFETLSHKARRQLTYRNKSQHVCKWNNGSDVRVNPPFLGGVECTNFLVTKVYYENSRKGHFNIHYLPPTVKDLQIIHCNQRYKVLTRMLPRDAERIDISRNAIFGTIDLRSLPLKTQHFLANDNRISSIEPLIDLPKSLVCVSLKANDIHQSAVFCDARSIPEVISIHLEGNKIKKSRNISRYDLGSDQIIIIK